MIFFLKSNTVLAWCLVFNRHPSICIWWDHWKFTHVYHHNRKEDQWVFRTLYCSWGKNHLKSTSIPSCRKCRKRFQNQFLKRNVSGTWNMWLAVAISSMGLSFLKLEDLAVTMTVMSQVRKGELSSTCLKSAFIISLMTCICWNTGQVTLISLRLTLREW